LLNQNALLQAGFAMSSEANTVAVIGGIDFANRDRE